MSEAPEVKDATTSKQDYINDLLKTKGEGLGDIEKGLLARLVDSANKGVAAQQQAQQSQQTIQQAQAALSKAQGEMQEANAVVSTLVDLLWEHRRQD